MRKYIIMLVYFCIMISVFSTTIYIPEDYETIQEGIDASEDGDSVIVSPGYYVENINFGGKLIVLGSLFYTTLDTSYISQTIIDGNEDGSVVTFNGEEDSTCVLSGFTIINGLGDEGGGICCEYYSGPRLEDLIIKNNFASEGGGVCCMQYTSTQLKNLTIKDNLAGCGGGLFCHYSSNLVLENLMISGNFSYGRGGGMSISGSNVNLKNLIIEDNQSGCCGGGIYFFASNSIIENVKIIYNMAADYAGGIFISESSTITFSSENRCNIYLNRANIGNYSNDIYSSNYISVIVDTFTVIDPGDNYAAPIEHFTFDIFHGLQETVNADLYVSPNGNNTNSGLSVTDPLRTIFHACSIIEADSLNPHTIYLLEGNYCQATNGEPFPLEIPEYVTLSGCNEETVILDAGGNDSVIRLNGSENVTLTNLTITNGSAEYGGGISCVSSILYLENLIINNNTSQIAGGGINCISSSLFLENIRIFNNTTEICGGGISLQDNSNAILSDITIEDNSSMNGGGVWISNGSSLVYEHSMVHLNSAENGGGLFCADSSWVQLEDVTVTYNSAECSGGGIFCESSNVSLLDVLISNNSAVEHGGGICCNNSGPVLEDTYIVSNTSYFGGGVSLVSASSPFFEQVMISINSAYNGGGMFCQDASSPVLSYSRISDNQAVNKGGGICCWENSSMVVDQVIITGNTSESGGGIYCWDGSNPILSRVTFENNTASYGGSVCCYNSSSPVLVNCILWNNLPQEIELMHHADPSSITVAYSDVLDGELGIEHSINDTVNWLEGNIDADPMFVNTETGDYHLTEYSPCIDAGTDYFYYEGEVLIDISEDEYYGIAPDMGVYEYDSSNIVQSELPENTKCMIINYPNPFNPETTLCYKLTKSGIVKIDVYNIKGQKVDELLNKEKESGEYKYTWDASDHNSGIYFIKIESGNFEKVIKTVLLK